MIKPVQFSSIYRQVLEPKCVDHSLFCNFIHSQNKSILTIGSTHLEVYNLLHENKTPYDLKFDHVLSFNFNEEVIDASIVRLYGDTLDSLIVSFEDAKVAVMQYDPMSHEVKTILLHHFEFECLKQNRSEFFKSPMLRVDPEQRCAVVLVYDKYLGVIPFRRSPDIISTSLATSETKIKSSKIVPITVPLTSITQHELFSGVGLLASNRPAPNLPSYVTFLNNLNGVRVNYILDMQFLHGYYEPTLLILYEAIGTFVGQALTRKDTCCMITLSLNLQKRTNPIIWHLENLPYDCFKVVPVPRPIGGILILSTNILIYLNQSQPSCGIALNGYAKILTNFPLRQISVLQPIALDGCECRFINSEQLLIINGTGDVFVVTFLLEPAMRTVIGAHIEKNYKTIVPKTISLCSSNYIFVGSQICDSTLLRFQKSETCGEVCVTSNIPDYLIDTCRPMKISSDGIESKSLSDGRPHNVKAYEFKVLDTIKNLGPIGTLTVSENYDHSSNDLNDTHHMRLANEMSFVEMVATTGRGEHGAVSLINFTVKPRLHSVFELSSDFCDMWWVEGSWQTTTDSSGAAVVRPGSDSVPMENDDPQSGDVILEKMDIDEEHEKPPVINSKRNYLILSKMNSTMILESDKEIVELEISGFKTDEATISAGNIGSILNPDTNEVNPMTYQVLANSVRLLNGSQLLEHSRLDTDWQVIQSSSAGNFILLRTDFEIFLVEVSSPNGNLCLDIDNNLIVKDKASTVILGQNNGHNNNNINQNQNGMARKYMRITKPNLLNRSQIISFSLYHDQSGFISRCLSCDDDDEDIAEMSDDETSKTVYNDLMNDIDFALYGFSKAPSEKKNEEPFDPVVAMKNFPEISDDPDEIELYLYGDKGINEGANNLQASSQDDDSKMVQVEESIFKNHAIPNQNQPARTWAFILYNDGNFEMYSVPDFVLQFKTVNFFDSPNLLINSLMLPDLLDIQSGYHNFQAKMEPEQKYEIIVCNIGRNQDRPVVFARNINEIVMYEILAPVPKQCRYIAELGNYMRMKKIPISCLIRPVKKARDDHKLSELHKTLSSRNTLMKPFENISGYRGLFISGSYPMWLFFTRDGHIRPYPMYIEGVVSCFATNPCPEPGSPDFAYFNNRGEMKLLNLPIGYDFEYQKAVKRISMNKHVHFVQYHIDSKTFAIVTSENVEVMSIFKLNAENSKEEEPIEREVDVIRAPLPIYTLQFYAIESESENDSGKTKPLSTNGRESLEPVPHAKVVFEDWDKVSCMTTVQLFSQMTYSGTKDFLAVGSNMSYGEEIPVRGKIMIVDIIDVVPEPGQVLTRHKMKIIYDVEQKGPVTALTSCKGYLVSAIGQKMYIWELKDNELVGVAFVDSEIYVQQLHCVRNLILTGDFLKSIQLLRFQSDLRVLSLVSKDSQARGVTCSNFFIDNENLGFMLADVGANVIIYSYNPLVEESRNGKQLVRNADIKLPTTVTCSLRINDRIRDPILYSSSSVTLAQELLRQSVYFGSASGAIFRLSPISNKQLIQMKLTEKNLSQCLHHYGGLHPKGARQYKFTHPELTNACGNVADGDLLDQYVSLPYSQRTEIAKKAGVEIDKILDDLIDIYCSTLHF